MKNYIIVPKGVHSRKQSTLKLLLIVLVFLFNVGNSYSKENVFSAPSKYVLLKKDIPLEKQVTQQDVLYDIHYDFNLKDKTIMVPSGCVLRFSGGRLYNGTIDLNNCFIEGNADIGCIIIGCPSNEDIYTRWFSNSRMELLVLLRNFCSCWYDDNSQILIHKNKRVIHVEKSVYTVTEGLDLRYEQDLTIDFGGSTIIDNIDTYDQLRHRSSSVIAMRESCRIRIGNCKYQMGNKKGKRNSGGSFIEIGGPHVTTIQPIYDVVIENIDGMTEGKIGETFIPIDVLGNCYNIEIGSVTWEGPVSSLVNLESALEPLKGTEVKARFGAKSWPYPDYYGLMPYNVSIHNVKGYNRPTARYGYIRTAGAYNVIIQNVYCRDVMEVIELFQGDAGNVRSAMNITVSNVSSYWSEIMSRPNYAVSVNITRQNPQTKTPNMENADIAMIRFVDCDFQDNSKGNADDHYMIRVYGNNGTTVFSNCRMRNTQRAVRIADIINTSILKHVTKFESCLFQNCVVGIDCQNALVSVKDCVFEAGKDQKSQIQYKMMGLSKDDLANTAAMLSVEDNMFRSITSITTPYISVSSKMNLPASFRFNVSKNVFNNTKTVPAIKASNVKLDAERNIGVKIVE